jgi:hypothetical protein
VIELLMHKMGNVLILDDATDIDEFEAIHEGAHVKVMITQPRNIKHHRMWFGLLKATLDAQDYFRTLDELHDAVKLAIGHSEERRTIDGQTYYHPKSIAFARMDQIAFRAFFDRAVELIIDRILPHTSQADLEERIYTILGEPRPSDLRRYSTAGEAHVQAT